jgi:hypothetical protein
MTTGLLNALSEILSCICAIQSRKYPLKGDTIQYVYTDSKHNNRLCRVKPIEKMNSRLPYDKQKYKEMVLDAAETVLGIFWL